MTRPDQCDPGRLQQLLEASLPELAESEVTDHVAACPTCQRTLENLAAGKGWWAEASDRLSRSVLNGSGHVSDGGSSHDDEAHHFATDFAVDFLEPSDDPAMLGRLSEYEIVEVIGRGGMGIVLKGFQKELHRHVAVKVLSPHLATSGAARRRFAREAQATAAVVHPHVMAIHSVNANAKLPYLVMPFVPCESLQERLNRQGPLDVKDVLRIGMQASLGLAAAHAQGLVHRDVKPANILLETNVDRVLLTDFGLARAVDDATLTRTGIIAGTPQYMSPEQANGDAVDHRSDLFSLGGVLYAMCTGRPPFRAETTFGVLRRIRETSPRSVREINPDIPRWLEQVIQKLLSKGASERIDSARDVAALLEQCLAHVQQPTTVPLPEQVADWVNESSFPEKTLGRRADGKFSRRMRWAVAAIAVTAGVSIAAWGLKTNPASTEVGEAEVGEKTSTDATVEESRLEHPLADSDLEWNPLQADFAAVARAIEPLEASAQRDLAAADSELSNSTDAPVQEKE